MTFIWFWVAELAFALAAYLVLGGFDLGVGLLSGVVRSPTVRSEMVDTISPVWDGNGTWLVIAGTILFGAFPGVYAIVLPALYIPLTAMLAGLVLRGVAIEFRHKAVSSRGIWDAMLCLGSFLAAFAQGVSVGTYAHGLPVSGLQYAGNGFEWCQPFCLWCGLALVIGYAALGAGWLILKSEGALQQFARAATTRLVPLTALVAGSVFILTLRMHPVVAERWFAHPVMFVLPTLSLGALVAGALAARSVAASRAYLWTALACVLLLLTLAISYLPLIIPDALTLAQVAAPPSSQSFMFWGAGLFVTPFIVAYTYVSYSVFRGKLRLPAAYS